MRSASPVPSQHAVRPMLHAGIIRDLPELWVPLLPPETPTSLVWVRPGHWDSKSSPCNAHVQGGLRTIVFHAPTTPCMKGSRLPQHHRGRLSPLVCTLHLENLLSQGLHRGQGDIGIKGAGYKPEWILILGSCRDEKCIQTILATPHILNTSDFNRHPVSNTHNAN